MDGSDYPNYIVTSSSDSKEIPNAEEREDEESEDDVEGMREFKVDDSTRKLWRLVCKRKNQGCQWMLRGKETAEKMWTISKFYTRHTCDMGDLPDDHCNLDTNMIVAVLVGDIAKSPRYPIKDCITAVLKVYRKTVSRQKTYLGHRRAHEIVYDGTHVYGVYDIKLLIAVGMDANGVIFPLAFVIAANESTNTWGLFLNYLRQHVIKDRMGICVISDRNAGILNNMFNLHRWQPPFAYHRHCLRHLKANFKKAYRSLALCNWMWAAAIEHQEKKFHLQMETIRRADEEAFYWLNTIDKDK
ncbi:uncharacterized protein LOC132061870 [Lycium ferocissimum]|uniref:uncharacterized protein LOC132061870 n=1 Tax=Lycium ferocissimum TaxID=112874 RepID=UPI0028169A8A|nr:uncharacterized protein LOC132061870 [Lycium ferocissimum]